MYFQPQIPDGANCYQHYLRYQDDYFHKLNLNNIRRRPNKFLFYGSNSLERKKADSTYYRTKNFKGKIKISTRTSPLTIDTFSLIEKQQKCNNTIRSMHLKKIQQDNLLFKMRITNTPCMYNHRTFENDFQTTKYFSRHLKKIKPINNSHHHKSMSCANTEPNEKTSRTSYMNK